MSLKSDQLAVGFSIFPKGNIVFLSLKIDFVVANSAVSAKNKQTKKQQQCSPDKVPRSMASLIILQSSYKSKKTQNDPGIGRHLITYSSLGISSIQKVKEIKCNRLCLRCNVLC